MATITAVVSLAHFINTRLWTNKSTHYMPIFVDQQEAKSTPNLSAVNIRRKILQKNLYPVEFNVASGMSFRCPNALQTVKTFFVILSPDLLWMKLRARSGKVRKFVFLIGCSISLLPNPFFEN